jgi:hypothetical protein
MAALKTLPRTSKEASVRLKSLLMPFFVSLPSAAGLLHDSVYKPVREY